MDKAPLILGSAENRGQHAVRSMIARIVIVLAVIFILFAVRHHVILVSVTEMRDKEVYPEPINQAEAEAKGMTFEQIMESEKLIKVKEPVTVERLLPEQAVIFDASISNIEYLSSGKIKRVFVEGVELPKVCET